MPLHLIKLCVGADSIEDLEAWRDTTAPGGGPMSHTTRMFPKRRDALLDGGSLYWVIKRIVQVRQRILDLEEVVGEDGIRRCRIWLDPEIVRTNPSPKRPFQGWRYLEPHEAPGDLTAASGGEDLPDELRRKLIELGAW
ncbi:DUF1489 domain-containing protein [Marinicauda salina]|uniref:DUF1489 domain-containing protein n=1 Tax=Marinicauda salina TaxID=2135793 RepID=A0A2U2BR67_9PROT|nr:DUF1489 domain-containing protein [Marinicauda salina]PWE16495.1 DUF1489 domain-containing protein [Marinicauda salina]